MTSQDRTLLRQHIEAVWGVRLPAIERDEVTLLPESTLPAWRLCAADIAEGRVHIWRPDVKIAERAALLQQIRGEPRALVEAPVVVAHEVRDADERVREQIGKEQPLVGAAEFAR